MVGIPLRDEDARRQQKPKPDYSKVKGTNEVRQMNSIRQNDKCKKRKIPKARNDRARLLKNFFQICDASCTVSSAQPAWRSGRA